MHKESPGTGNLVSEKLMQATRPLLNRKTSRNPTTSEDFPARVQSAFMLTDLGNVTREKTVFQLPSNHVIRMISFLKFCKTHPYNHLGLVLSLWKASFS